MFIVASLSIAPPRTLISIPYSFITFEIIGSCADVPKNLTLIIFYLYDVSNLIQYQLVDVHKKLILL